MKVRHKKMARSAQRTMWKGPPRPWDKYSDVIWQWHKSFRGIK